MDEAMIEVRADTAGFAREVAQMRAELEGALGAGAARAGDAIERGLLRAVRTGKLGFDDLKRSALAALSQIAAAQLDGALGLAPGGRGGLVGIADGLVGALLGLPGRAGGGPVSPGRAYMVGERGPELFVPTASGRVEPSAGARARDVRIAITVAAGAGEAPRALERSGRQVARAVRRALAED